MGYFYRTTLHRKPFEAAIPFRKGLALQQKRTPGKCL